MSNHCQPVRFKEDDGWLIRFFYYGHRISLEVFHALADGAGALTLFRTLLAVYLRELGHQIPNTGGILDVDEPPAAEEQEDAYFRYAKSRVRRGMGESRAYQNTGTPEPFYTLNVTMGLVPLDRLRAVAKGYGASVTEYLSAVLIESIFGIPGVGMLTVNSIRQKDIPQTTASILFLAFIYVVIMLVVDVLYAYIDPRLKSKIIKSRVKVVGSDKKA